MRQPKFKFGENVKFNVLYQCKDYPEMTKYIQTDGIVIGIYYDPNNISTGRPFYQYRVAKEFTNKTFMFQEEDLIGVENDQ